MKNILLIFTFLISGFSLSAQTTAADSASETILIFFRHAEKLDDGTNNPSLSSEGKARSLRLSELLLQEFKISAIYSTPYNRTRETVYPVADTLNIKIQEYGLGDPRGLIQSILENYEGGTVLIAGHSNTTPLFVNLVLGEKKFQQLDEKAYGDLFVVKIDSTGKASVEKRAY